MRVVTPPRFAPSEIRTPLLQVKTALLVANNLIITTVPSRELPRSIELVTRYNRQKRCVRTNPEISNLPSQRQHVNSRSNWHYPVYTLVVMISTGCICPGWPTRGEISRDVMARTGHELGPQKSSPNTVIPHWVDWEDGLSEEEAIAIGLWNNPAYQELLADLQVTQADIAQAAQLQNPQMTTMIPLGPKQWEFALQVPLDVLWLRPIRVAAAQLESQRVAERLVQDGLNVVRDIRVAYVDWQLAEQRAVLLKEGAALREEIATIAAGRLAAGEAAELDVSATRLDAMFGAADAVPRRA